MGLLYCKLYVTARCYIKPITMQQGQEPERKNELLRNVGIMTKSSTGTLFVFLALLFVIYPKMCLFVLYVILGQTTPALQSDSGVCEFVV